MNVGHSTRKGGDVTLSKFDYDTITIRPEVNGHMEPLTDP